MEVVVSFGDDDQEYRTPPDAVITAVLPGQIVVGGDMIIVDAESMIILSVFTTVQFVEASVRLIVYVVVTEGIGITGFCNVEKPVPPIESQL